SMGSLLLAGGTPGKRLALPNSRILIHQPSGGYQGQSADVEIHAREILDLRSRMDEIYSKHTNQDLEKVHLDMDRDRYFKPEEAAAQAHLDDDGRARLERLAEGLRDLPEPGLSALILRELEGRDYEEVARLAHLTSTEARQEVFRARLELLGDVDGPTEHCNEIRAAMSK